MTSLDSGDLMIGNASRWQGSGGAVKDCQRAERRKRSRAGRRLHPYLPVAFRPRGLIRADTLCFRRCTRSASRTPFRRRQFRALFDGHDVSEALRRQAAPEEQVLLNGRPAEQARNKCGLPSRQETSYSDDDRQLKRLLELEEQDRRRETAFFANSVDDGSGSGSHSRASRASAA